MNEPIKSYIFYSERLMSGEPVDCVYLLKGSCRAQPFFFNESDYYKPTEDEKKEFCLNLGRFRQCPRLMAYQAHLQVVKK